MKKTIGRPRKSERNKIIYQLVKKDTPYKEIMEMFKFKAKSTVSEIYHREVRERVK